MRSGPVLLVITWFAFASCAQRAAARVAGDGEFVLELGGSGRSLATSLRNCKVELLPAPEPLPAPVVEPGPAPKDPLARDPSTNGEQKSDPESPQRDEKESKADPKTQPEIPVDPALPDAVTYFEVQLGPQETLMDIASKHLGSAKRFKEIMALNGFSERDTRRLKAGTRIKVPKAKSGAAK